MNNLEVLLQENEWLIYNLVSKYEYAIKYSAYDKNDFLQEGRLAFIEAYNTFDEKRGTKFLSYATSVISNRLSDFALANSNQMKFPRLYTKVWRIAKKNNLTKNDIEEIAQITDLPIEKVIEIMEWEQKKKVQSLNAPIVTGEGETFSLCEILEGDETDFTNIFVEEFIDTLDEQQKILVALRLDEKTQREISASENIPQSTVNRMLKKIANNLEVYISKEEFK